MSEGLHAQLVGVAGRWLKKQRKCPLVITELVTAARETPDAIGWNRLGRSVLVECKTSRADFAADLKKFFRREPECGMGDCRFYLTMPGLLRVEELPERWGLLEVTGRGVVIVRDSHAPDCVCLTDGPYAFRHSPAFAKKDESGEFAMMLSLIRRLSGVGVLGRATVDVAPYTRDEHGNELTIG